MRWIGLFVFPLLLFVSCKKEESNVPLPKDPGDTTTIDTPAVGYFKIRFIDENGSGLPNEGFLVFNSFEKYLKNEDPLLIDSTSSRGDLRFDGDLVNVRYFFRPVDPTSHSRNKVIKFTFDGQGDSLDNQYKLIKSPFLKKITRKDAGGMEKVLFEYLDFSYSSDFRINASTPMSLGFYQFLPSEFNANYEVIGGEKVSFIEVEFDQFFSFQSIAYTIFGPLGFYYGEPSWRYGFFSEGGFKSMAHTFNYRAFTHYHLWDNLFRQFEAQKKGEMTEEKFWLKIDSACNYEYLIQRTWDEQPNPFLLIDHKILPLFNLYLFGCEKKIVSVKDLWVDTPFNLGKHNLLHEEDSLMNMITTGTHIYNTMGYPEESHYTIDSAGVTIEDYTLYFEYEL